MGERYCMVAMPRAGLVVLFISVFAGFVAGAWSREIWGGSIIGVIATVLTIVAVYTALAYLLRRAGIFIE
jgi:uncharacterized membrane protein